MKILIIRHADPDYSIDSLTEKGWREAELLAERIAPLEVKSFYVSPLGRARDTASRTFLRNNREAEVHDWLREFHAPIMRDDSGRPRNTWDWLPNDWVNIPDFHDAEKWHQVPVMKDGNVYDEVFRVWNGLDKIIAEHGYIRDCKIYRAEKPNMDTIVFFCHFGVECVMLAHLLGISAMSLWHGTCALPSSVTTLVTEERREGIAAFRMLGFGDLSHLYIQNEPPAFSARFCEMYTNEDERHD